MSARRHVLGIDLGTTNTLCAVWEAGQARPLIRPIDQPVSSETAFRERDVLPSAVAVQPGGTVIVGEYAKLLARYGRDNVVTSVKQHMGTPWVKRMHGRDWTAEQISACILKAVREGLGSAATQAEWVVITVPAGFGTEQRRATQLAARLAGFDLKRTKLFDEPAAALLHQTRLVPDAWPTKKRLLILDIGGGTLDVSLMTVQRRDGVLMADILGRSRFNELAAPGGGSSQFGKWWRFCPPGGQGHFGCPRRRLGKNPRLPEERRPAGGSGRSRYSGCQDARAVSQIAAASAAGSGRPSRRSTCLGDRPRPVRRGAGDVLPV